VKTRYSRSLTQCAVLTWESPAFFGNLGHKLGDGILSQVLFLVPTHCRLGEQSRKEGFRIRVKFTQHQYQRWDGIHRRTGYSLISVILIFLLRTPLIVFGLFCMLYSDILYALIVVLELERVLRWFAPTFCFSPSLPGQWFENYEFNFSISPASIGFWCCGLGFLRL